MFQHNYSDKINLAAIKGKLYDEVCKNQKRSVIIIVVGMILLVLLIGLIGGAIHKTVTCPTAYPHAYHNGDLCCKINSEDKNALQGENCDGAPISLSCLRFKGNETTKRPGKRCRNIECPSGTSTSDFKPFKYKNKCFMVSIDAMPWNAARQVCKRLDNNYDLAVIDNEDENTALENFAISSGKEFWIGFHDISTEGKFTWVNGSDNAFGTVHGIKPWHSGEPNNFRSKEDCVQIINWSKNGNDNVGWNDGNCRFKKRFICGPASINNYNGK